MSNFGSYVKALRKASTHLTEEPLFRPYGCLLQAFSCAIEGVRSLTCDLFFHENNSGMMVDCLFTYC